MLPFMDKKKEASVIVESIVEDGEKETEEKPSEEFNKYEDGLRVAASELMNSFKMGDEKALMRSLKSIIEMVNNS